MIGLMVIFGSVALIATPGVMTISQGVMTERDLDDWMAGLRRADRSVLSLAVIVGVLGLALGLALLVTG